MIEHFKGNFDFKRKINDDYLEQEKSGIRHCYPLPCQMKLIFI